MKTHPRNELKVALAERRRLIGLWCNFASGATVEALADAGFDWLLLEMEHAPNELASLHQQLMALKGSATLPIVRVPVLDITIVKRVLDLGAPSLMIPNVRNAAEARAAVSYTRFAPEGLRGVASSTRAGGYTRTSDFLARANDEVALVLQIESREAVGELDAICRTPGVDAVFIGPSDLAAEMGYRGQSRHPSVLAVIKQAVAVAQAANKSIGILYTDGELEAFLDMGINLTAVGSDMHLLVRGADALAKRFKSKA
jgi:2-keto-3-deoxy-L-rhamnonate aldolase RhmA